MKAIIVTGTPATGKTTFAKELAKELNAKYIDVNKIITPEGYDKERECEIVDTEKLNQALIKLIQKGYKLIIDSHLSHYLPSKYVEKCYVTKCDLKQLETRLKARNYKKPKIRENLDAEIFDICRNEAIQQGHEVETINTSL